MRAHFRLQAPAWQKTVKHEKIRYLRTEISQNPTEIIQELRYPGPDLVGFRNFFGTCMKIWPCGRASRTGGYGIATTSCALLVAGLVWGYASPDYSSTQKCLGTLVEGGFQVDFVCHPVNIQPSSLLSLAVLTPPSESVLILSYPSHLCLVHGVELSRRPSKVSSTHHAVVILQTIVITLFMRLSSVLFSPH